MDRRLFLETGSRMALASAGLCAFGCSRAAAAGRLDRIGVQLYTVRSEMADSVEVTLDRVAQIGYHEVEFAEYFGRSPGQIRDALAASGLAAPAAHVPVEALENAWDDHLAAAQTMGHRYLVVPSLPEEQRRSLDDYRRFAELFNRAGQRARAADIGFAYHNHDFEFVPIDGQVPYDVLLAETDPALVALELDLFWVTKGGRDPLAYFSAYPARFPLLHVKDMSPAGEMADVGAGEIDFPEIFAQQSAAGVRHFFVEHDHPADPYTSIRNSFVYLEQLRF